MYNRVASKLTAKYHPETLRRVGTQVEALISQHSSLLIHKRAIERQLSSIAASIKEQVLVLIPRNVFLLLEMRGSGGVSNQLEQITHIVREEGYWIPRVRVQNYYRQDVYRLGKSVQRLFDDFAVLHQRVEQFNARLWHIKKCQQMQPEMPHKRCSNALRHPRTSRRPNMKWMRLSNCLNKPIVAVGPGGFK